ncbi:ATP-binding protein [Streptomyces griseofuscus]|uniref:ATP-binding protein n=1 Tax=Streptomyces griseofuscus TaxID=146922 RepID=UPI0033D2F842
MTLPDDLDEERGTEEMSVATTAPAVPGAREPVRASGPVAAIADILRRRGLDPARAAHTEDRPDSTSEYQREVNRLAWANSLNLSGHGDYARYNIAVLDEAQYPQHMRKYVDQLAAARTHNRAQLGLPEEERRIVRPNIQHLIAHGTVGSGKTVAAAAAGAYAVECGLMARFVSHSMYLAWLRPDSAPAGLTPTQVRERYERCDLLILDDLCNEMDEYATNHVRTHTSNLITARLNSGRATLFTTNISFDQVAAVLGDRLASRVGNRATVLRMVGDDRRKPQRW